LTGNPISETGLEWFEKQSDTVKRDLLGEGRFNALQENKFTLDKITRTYPDDVYGQMRRAASLKELLAEE
jgi:hypothetical protein